MRGYPKFSFWIQITLVFQSSHKLRKNTTVLGGVSHERGGDTRRKFWIKPLKETNLGVAQAFVDPRDHFKTQTNI